MTDRPRIYLDHAATSWPKSDAVLAAMDQYARSCGAAVGRGGYASATEASRIVQATRRTIATLVNAPEPESISFHSGGTAALNAAIHGILRPGDHVVTTAAEHNSVLRPLEFWKSRFGVSVTVVPVDSIGRVDADQLLEQVTDQTRLVAVTSASNVTGAVQPIARIGAALADHPAVFLCDAAQTFGALPINVAEDHIDLLAAPGHKCSGGPFGTAFLYVDKRLHRSIAAWTQGGTGTQSESMDMPTQMPAMLESGNLNVPAIAGWNVGLTQRLVEETTESDTSALARYLHQRLGQIAGIRVVSSGGPLPIASLLCDSLAPSDLATILDSEFGIEVRSGLHCAALVHDCIGSSPQGTLRISGGRTTTAADIDAVCNAVTQIVASMDVS